MAGDDHIYHEKDALAAAVTGTSVTGAMGLLASALQNAKAKDNRGITGVFTRTGKTVFVTAAMGGAYAFASNASANLRRKDDSWNPAIGGFLAGSILGLTSGTMPKTLGMGAFSAVILAVFSYGGGSLTGYKKLTPDEQYEKKEFIRNNRRRPIEETISEIGEGRGVYGPGYQERRRETLKEKYGIEVPVYSS